jgi:hypothetical protein
MKKIKLALGQSILEVVLATTLIAVGLIAALSLGNSSQKSASFSRNVNVAGNYSYQVTDWVRNLRTLLGWQNLVYLLQEDDPTNVTYCLNDSLPSTEAEFQALGSGSCPELSTIPDTIFSREISFDLTDVADGKITGSVVTSWQEEELRTNNLSFELTAWQ